MPMTEQLRVRLNHAIESLRGPAGLLADTWTQAEINAATRTLAADPRHPRDLWRQAIDAAFNLGHDRAVAITWAGTAPTTAAPTPTPTADTGWHWCKRHEAKVRLRPDGTPSCCWNDRTDPEPYRRTGTGGPPPDFRERFEAARGAK